MRCLVFAVRFVFASATAALIPDSVWACPACVVSNPKTAATYLGMTLVMSTLPILLIGGIGYWLWRRHS
jgi:membrane protein DedA with SNARE-associated domain